MSNSSQPYGTTTPGESEGLIALGVPVNDRIDGSGMTALHLAVEHSCHAALRILLDTGAEPDHEAQGLTPLGLAVDVMLDSVCQNGGPPDHTAIDLLLLAGASPHAGTPSALDVARRYGAEPNRDLLRRLEIGTEDGARSRSTLAERD